MFSERRVGIITQARTTSTRLPRKVLLEVNGKTVLEHHLDRLKNSGYNIFVATTVNQTDDAIASLCEDQGIFYYRGSEQDVLSRFYECAKKYHLEVIVRVTSDCPLIDGKLIKEGVDKYLSSPENSYVSNCIERTYPRGLDFEIFNFKALENAYKNEHEASEREHVTPFIRNPQKNTGVQLVHIKRAHDASGYRLTLDEKDDWILIQKMMIEYHAEEKDAEALIKILQDNKALNLINAHIEQKKV
jgi:spore coat polysaccharide biosynthesis protein SpsF